MCRVFNKSNRVVRFGPMWVLIMGLASPTWAAEQSPRQQVRGAEKAFAEGDYPTALEKFTAAQEAITDSAELAYNRGLAHYKLGQFAEARDRFQEALATRHRELEAKAKFNLGNCAYSEALDQSQKPDEATKLLNQAITHYRDSLEVAPDDNDARANIELAQQMIRKLEEQQQQQPQNQDKNQDQNEQNQEQQQQQENQSGNQNDNQSESENQQQQSSSEGNDNQQQPQPEQQESEEPQEQPQEPQDENPQQAEPQETPSEQDQQVEMTPQEAERMLQAVRDKERKRSEEKAKRMKAQRARVARDW